MFIISGFMKPVFVFWPPMKLTLCHTRTHTQMLNITEQLLAWKSKPFKTVRNGRKQYESLKNPARYNPVCNEAAHLPTLGCVENLPHWCRHTKSDACSYKLQEETVKRGGLGSLSALVTLCWALQTLHVITTCPQAVHFLLSPTVS